MSEWYQEKKEGWPRASEEFKRVARDVRDVEQTQETCKLQRQMLRNVNPEEIEISCYVRLGALRHEELETRSAQAAADHARSAAKEGIHRDRLLAKDAVQRHEQVVRQQLQDETIAYIESESAEAKEAKRQ